MYMRIFNTSSRLGQYHSLTQVLTQYQYQFQYQKCSIPIPKISSIEFPGDSFYYNTRSTLKPVLKVKSTRTKQADNHFFQRIVPLSNWLMKEHNVDSFVEPNIFKPRVKQLFKRLFASDEYVL